MREPVLWFAHSQFFQREAAGVCRKCPRLLLFFFSFVNGKQNFENMTFNISFIHDGSVMNIQIQKYHNGVLNSTSSYSYMTNNDMSTLRANIIGYQSNVDFISSQYTVYYEP